MYGNKHEGKDVEVDGRRKVVVVVGGGRLWVVVIVVVVVDGMRREKNWVAAAAKLSTFKYSQDAVVGTRYRFHVRLWAKETLYPIRHVGHIHR